MPDCSAGTEAELGPVDEVLELAPFFRDIRVQFLKGCVAGTVMSPNLGRYTRYCAGQVSL